MEQQQQQPAPAPPPPLPDVVKVAALAHPLPPRGVAGGERGAPQDPDPWAPLMSSIGNAQIVLLGECTHGTAEFYEDRAAITKRLVEDKGFTCVAVEANWAEMLRVGGYVCGDERDHSADKALSGLVEFPVWMWRNEATRDLVQWLREHNDRVHVARKAGEWNKDGCHWFGMDVRGLPEACDEVLTYLECVDPAFAAEVRRTYSIFEPYRDRMEDYGRAIASGPLKGQEESIRVALEHTLAEIQRRSRAEWEWLAGPAAHMNAEQCADVVVSGEEYYRKRATDPGGLVTWNTRDQHMVQTLLRLRQQVGGMSRSGLPPKIIVWAHNSHVGDSRATELGRRSAQVDETHMANLGAGQEWNLGHMVRETFGRDESFIVGFSTANGTVSAAKSWGEEVRCFRLKEPQAHTQEAAMEGVGEEVFKRVGKATRDFVLLFRGGTGSEELVKLLGTHPRTQRMIGVSYHPDTERRSHFVQVHLPEQVDALVHVSKSHAVHPLLPTPRWEAGLAQGGE
eukprot:Hpha_TRINITY_DN15316_c7_g1::TRINITY_DN15316_c7_g1_i1::g.90049::m.90049